MFRMYSCNKWCIVGGHGRHGLAMECSMEALGNGKLLSTTLALHPPFLSSATTRSSWPRVILDHAHPLSNLHCQRGGLFFLNGCVNPRAQSKRANCVYVAFQNLMCP